MAEESARKARIASVVAATGIALACGTNYAYSAWAPDFAAHMELSATQSNAIGAAGNVGQYAMGIPAGILIDNRSPRVGVLVGAAALGAGYVPIYRAYLAGPGSTSVALLSFCSFLTGAGSCTAFSGAIKTATYNWPTHRGTASAFPLSAFGLSAFIFTTVANLTFGDDTQKYILTLAIGTVALNLISCLFLRLIPTSPQLETSTGNGRPGSTRAESSRLRHRSTSSEDVRGKPDDETDEHDNLMERRSSSSDIDCESMGKSVHSLKDHPEITGVMLLSQLKFWQLFCMLGLLAGVGIMTINNIGNDVGALWRAYDPSKDRAFIHEREQFHVGVLSISSFCGRLLSGIGSDVLIKRLHASRLWCLVVSSSIFAVSQAFALVIRDPHWIFLVSSLNGLGYGALFGVYPPLVADAFGVQGLSLNWGFILLATVITGNIYNICYGKIFDRNSVAGICTKGLGCYVDAYWVTLASSLTGIVLSLWIIQHDRMLWKRRRVVHEA